MRSGESNRTDTSPSGRRPPGQCHGPVRTARNSVHTLCEGLDRSVGGQAHTGKDGRPEADPGSTATVRHAWPFSSREAEPDPEAKEAPHLPLHYGTVP